MFGVVFVAQNKKQVHWLLFFVLSLRALGAQDIADKSSALDQGQQLLDGYEKKVEQLHDRLEALQRELGVRDSTIEALQAQDGEKQEMTNKIEEITQQLEQVIREKDAEIDTLEETLKGKEAEMDELTKRLKSDDSVCFFVFWSCSSLLVLFRLFRFEQEHEAASGALQAEKDALQENLAELQAALDQKTVEADAAANDLGAAQQVLCFFFSEFCGLEKKSATDRNWKISETRRKSCKR